MPRSTTPRSSAGHGSVRTRFVASLSDDAGFTVAEALVAFVIFALIAVPATIGLVQTIQLTAQNRDRVAAANLATAQLQQLRLLNSVGHLSNANPSTVTLHQTAFTVTSTLNPPLPNGCANGTTRTVVVTISWAGTQSVHYSSQLAC